VRKCGSGRPLNLVVSQHMGPSDVGTVREFQRRRATTFRHSKFWIAMAAIGFVGVFAFNKRLDDFLVFLFFMSAFIGIAVVIFVVKKHYRCPSCEEVVWTYEGVSLNPHECPHCHARLSK
jgi:hypothetical protein